MWIYLSEYWVNKNINDKISNLKINTVLEFKGANVAQTVNKSR